MPDPSAPGSDCNAPSGNSDAPIVPPMASSVMSPCPVSPPSPCSVPSTPPCAPLDPTPRAQQCPCPQQSTHRHLSQSQCLFGRVAGCGEGGHLAAPALLPYNYLQPQR